MYGRGSIGMLAIDNSTADNAAQYTVDTLWIDDNDTTSLHTDLPGQRQKIMALVWQPGQTPGWRSQQRYCDQPGRWCNYCI
ncbi:hypothetical protein OIU92_28740 [Escherichia coli]|nr:hypothetical protein [Escherichia coli]